jgi:hypothetical protein
MLKSFISFGHGRSSRSVASLSLVLAALLLAVLPGQSLADSHGSAAHEKVAGGERAAAVQVSAVISDIDPETREITLQLPSGSYVTLTATDAIKRFDEFAVGDAIVATYITSLAGEVREPTPEEKENPWQELDAAAVAGLEVPPGVAGMRVIKAVCTIEGMNRVAGTVMIQDPRGKYHLIGDVAPEKFEGRMLGETIVMIYSEAVALTLEKAAAADLGDR